MVSFKTLAVAAAAVAGTNAAESICNKYTAALLKENTPANQYTLLTLLVKTAAIGNFTGPGTKNPTLPGSMVNVPGILAKGNVNGTDVELLPYFTGELATSNVNGMPAGVNWLDTNSTELATNVTYVGDAGSNGYRLLSHLIEYFGGALGCSEYGMGAFPAYGGDNSMTNVHRFMDLNYAQVYWFIENVGLSAKSFGVSDSDISTVATELTELFNMKCAPPVAVEPDTPAMLQAICLAESCPLATSADCGLYTDIATAVSSATATVSPASYAYSETALASTTAMASSAMSTSSAMASSSYMASSTTSGMAYQTGAAVANGVSGVLALVAGAAAFAL